MGNPSKKKGTGFESEVVGFGEPYGLKLTRKALHGSKDEGDIDGYEVHGKPVTAECKNCVDMRLAEWTNQARIESENAGTEYYIVIHKRRGAGRENFGLTYVTTTLDCWNRMAAEDDGDDGR